MSKLAQTAVTSIGAVGLVLSAILLLTVWAVQCGLHAAIRGRAETGLRALRNGMSGTSIVRHSRVRHP